MIGVGIETADMLVQEVLARNMRDRRAIARYAGLTGSPDESGTKRQEKGLTLPGNALDVGGRGIVHRDGTEDIYPPQNNRGGPK